VSIRTEINRIKTNVNNSFTAVKDSGVVVSGTKTSDTLPAAIRKIPETIYADINETLDAINGEVI
jgi:hypothetical protein